MRPKLEVGHSYMKRICSVTSSSCVFKVFYLTLLIFSKNVNCNITMIMNLWSSYCCTIRNHLCSWDQAFVHLLPHSSIIGHSIALTFSLFLAVLHYAELKNSQSSAPLISATPVHSTEHWELTDSFAAHLSVLLFVGMSSLGTILECSWITSVFRFSWVVS